MKKIFTLSLTLLFLAAGLALAMPPTAAAHHEQNSALALASSPFVPCVDKGSSLHEPTTVARPNEAVDKGSSLHEPTTVARPNEATVARPNEWPDVIITRRNLSTGVLAGYWTTRTGLLAFDDVISHEKGALVDNVGSSTALLAGISASSAPREATTGWRDANPVILTCFTVAPPRTAPALNQLG